MVEGGSEEEARSCDESRSGPECEGRELSLCPSLPLVARRGRGARARSQQFQGPVVEKARAPRAERQHRERAELKRRKQVSDHHPTSARALSTFVKHTSGASSPSAMVVMDVLVRVGALLFLRVTCGGLG